MKSRYLASCFFYEDPTAEHLEDLEVAMEIAVMLGQMTAPVADNIIQNARRHYNEMQSLQQNSDDL